MRMFIFLSILISTLTAIPLTSIAAEYDVTAYGAVADDGIDDLVGINAAIAAADSGDTVVLPEGTFHVSATIILTGGITFAGQGAEKSTIQYLEEKVDTVLRIQTDSHVTVHDLTIAGSDSSNQGIVMSNTTGNTLTDLVIRDITIPEGFTHGIYCASNVNNSLFSNITISNIAVNSVWGSGIRLAWGSCHNQVLDCTMTDLGRGGILCNNGSNGNIILRNTIQRIALAPDAPGLGIEVWGQSDSCIVEDNVIDHWLSIAGSSFCASRRNTVAASGNSWQTFGIEYATGEYDVFADNIVGEGQRLGISISGNESKRYTLFIRNSIKYATTWGMQCQGDGAGANYLYFYDNIFGNTYEEHPEAWYSGQGHALRFNDDCNNIVFEKNYLLDNGSAALQYGGTLDSLSFIENIFVGNEKVFTGSYSGQSIEYVNNSLSGNSSNYLPERDTIEGSHPAAGWSATMEDGNVRFVNESSDADGVIATTLWDLGEGIPTNELSPLHTYPADGIYPVTLTVWDNDGLGGIAPGAILLEGDAVTMLSAPVITTETLPDMPEASMSSVQIEAGDTDAGDELTFELLSTPDWMSISEDGLLAVTPPEGTVGFRKTLVVRVTDKAGLSDAAMYSIGVAEPTAVEESPEELSGLMTPFPNPFNPSVTIPFCAGEHGPVTISIYAANGQRVAVLFDGDMNAGNHRITWDATGHSSGIYFCRFSQGATVDTQKLLYLR